ncbi:MAG TPA: SDR family oxidoreductase [Solirubrobacterales bacterium]|nr:SDR family oxidoreductase [Solirubrobacterales bacterium]
MEVAIAGGHGKIALMLGGLLVERGNAVFGLIRDPAQEGDLHAVGVEPVICDIEGDDDVTEAVSGAEAVVFAAGAGPGSGAERKWTVDYGGAVKLIDAAKAEGIDRYVMVSAMGATEPPPEGGEAFGEYLRAKAKADSALLASGLAYTIVRPGGLTDDPPSGRVQIGERLERGEIPRADVAEVLAAVLGADNAIGKTFDLIAGEVPVLQAVSAL